MIRLAALVFLICSAPVRAAPVYTGVEDLLVPMAILVGPFIVAHDLLFGSDDNAIRATHKEATQTLDQFKTTLPVTGLYVGPLDLQHALYGLLVESRIPYVEIDSGASAWLAANAADPAQLLGAAGQAKVLRLSLGERQDPACFRWKNENSDFTLQAPVRPGTCLVAHFGTTPQSSLRLQVNTAKVSKRRLEWQLVEQASNRLLLSIPFWQSQTKGQPLRVAVSYRSRQDDSPWIRMMRKLSPPPAVAAGDTHGQPYLLDWLPEIDRQKEARLKGSMVVGEVREAQLDGTASNRGPANEAWSSAYQRALPAHAQLCNDFSQSCSFKVKNVRITAADLVLLGSFIRTKGGLDQVLASQIFEWVVPRADIPGL